MDKKKKMREVLAEIEEKFACVPQIVRYFQRLEMDIRYYNCYQWENGVTKERLLQKQQTLTRFVEQIDNVDLSILFYLRELGVGNRYKLRKMLKEQYEAQCNFYNELYQTQEKFDVCSVGERRAHKLERVREKKE